MTKSALTPSTRSSVASSPKSNSSSPRCAAVRRPSPFRRPTETNADRAKIRFRRRKGSGVDNSAAARILGVDSDDYTSASEPTARVQRGRAMPCSSASCSANAARIASSGVPVRAGGSAIAAATSSTCCCAQSAKPRNRVQSIFKRPRSTSTAVASAAIAGRSPLWRLSMTSSRPAAARSRRSIDSVTSVSPFSMRETIEVATPARAASARRDRPAPVRAEHRIAPPEQSVGVAYTQPERITEVQIFVCGTTVERGVRGRQPSPSFSSRQTLRYQLSSARSGCSSTSNTHHTSSNAIPRACRASRRASANASTASSRA